MSAESAIWRDIPVADATAAFDSGEMKVAVTNAPIFAHTTEASANSIRNDTWLVHAAPAR